MPKHIYPESTMSDLAAARETAPIINPVPGIADFGTDLIKLKGLIGLKLLNPEIAKQFQQQIAALKLKCENSELSHVSRQKTLALMHILEEAQRLLDYLSTNKITSIGMDMLNPVTEKHSAADDELETAGSIHEESNKPTIGVLDLLRKNKRDQAVENAITNSLDPVGNMITNFLVEITEPEGLTDLQKQARNSVHAPLQQAITNIVRYSLVKYNYLAFNKFIPSGELDDFIRDNNLESQLVDAVADSKVPWTVNLSLKDLKVYNKLQWQWFYALPNDNARLEMLTKFSTQEAGATVEEQQFLKMLASDPEGYKIVKSYLMPGQGIDNEQLVNVSAVKAACEKHKAATKPKDDELKTYEANLEQSKKDAAKVHYYAEAAKLYANAKTAPELEVLSAVLVRLGLAEDQRKFILNALNKLLEEPSNTDWLKAVPIELFNLLPSILQYLGDPSSQENLLQFLTSLQQILSMILPKADGDSMLLSNDLNGLIGKILAFEALQQLPAIQAAQAVRKPDSEERKKLGENVGLAGKALVAIGKKPAPAHIEIPLPAKLATSTPKERKAESVSKWQKIKQANELRKIVYAAFITKNPPLLDNVFIGDVKAAIATEITQLYANPKIADKGVNEDKAFATINLLKANIQLLDKLQALRFNDLRPHIKQLLSHVWKHKQWKRLFSSEVGYVKALFAQAATDLVQQQAAPIFKALADFMVDFAAAGKNIAQDVKELHKANIIKNINNLVQIVINPEIGNADISKNIEAIRNSLVAVGADDNLINTLLANLQVLQKNQKKIQAIQQAVAKGGKPDVTAIINLVQQLVNPLSLTQLAADPFNQNLAAHFAQIGLAAHASLNSDNVANRPIPGLSQGVNDFVTDLERAEQGSEIGQKITAGKQHLRHGLDRVGTVVTAYHAHKVVAAFKNRSAKDPELQLSPVKLKELRQVWLDKLAGLTLADLQAERKDVAMMRSLNVLLSSDPPTSEYFWTELNKLSLHKPMPEDLNKWFNDVKKDYHSALRDNSVKFEPPVASAAAAKQSQLSSHPHAKDPLKDLKIQLDLIINNSDFNKRQFKTTVELAKKLYADLHDPREHNKIDSTTEKQLQQLITSICDAKINHKDDADWINKLAPLLQKAEQVVKKLFTHQVQQDLQTVITVQSNFLSTLNPGKKDLPGLQQKQIVTDLVKNAEELATKVDALIKLAGPTHPVLNDCQSTIKLAQTKPEILKDALVQLNTKLDIEVSKLKTEHDNASPKYSPKSPQSPKK